MFISRAWIENFDFFHKNERFFLYIYISTFYSKNCPFLAMISSHRFPDCKKFRLWRLFTNPAIFQYAGVRCLERPWAIDWNKMGVSNSFLKFFIKNYEINQKIYRKCRYPNDPQTRNFEGKKIEPKLKNLKIQKKTRLNAKKNSSRRIYRVRWVR